MPRRTSIIVATAENGVIGQNGQMPWRLPADLRHFREITTGHTIIMGRTTFESIGRPLPNRTNIILTKDPKYSAPGCIIAHSFEEALQKPDDKDEVFIIGGANVYRQALQQNLADRIYLTIVYAKPEGDTFFEFDSAKWRIVNEEHHEADDTNQYPFTFQTLDAI